MFGIRMCYYSRYGLVRRLLCWELGRGMRSDIWVYTQHLGLRMCLRHSCRQHVSSDRFCSVETLILNKIYECCCEGTFGWVL